MKHSGTKQVPACEHLTLLGRAQSPSSYIAPTFPNPLNFSKRLHDVTQIQHVDRRKRQNEIKLAVVVGQSGEVTDGDVAAHAIEPVFNGYG